MNLKDYYQVMEVSSRASQEEIKQAYQRLARKYHPDISKEPEAETRFKEVNEAYEILKNPEKRADYNASFQIVSPYTYAWLRAKRDAWVRSLVQQRTKRAATVRAKLQGVSSWKKKIISVEIPRPKIVLPSFAKKSIKSKPPLKTKLTTPKQKTSTPETIIAHSQVSKETEFSPVIVPVDLTTEISNPTPTEPQISKEADLSPVVAHETVTEIPRMTPTEPKIEQTVTKIPAEQEIEKIALKAPEIAQVENPKQSEAPPIQQTEQIKSTEFSNHNYHNPPPPPKPKKRSRYLPILIGLLLLLLIGVGVGGYLGYQEFLRLQNHQALVDGLLRYDEQAIATFEQQEVKTQQEILQEAEVKNALVTFYQNSPTPVFTHLNHFEESVQAEILDDDVVYETLKNHYYHQIDQEVEVDNFAKAFHLLETLYNKYPYSRELSNKFEEISDSKQQRLAELTERYMECADQTLAPLLERTHCMAEARKKIEYVGIEHSLPIDSTLPMMYTEEIEYAFSQKKYEYVEKILLDWQNLQPQPSKQRQAWWEKLRLHQQTNNIIAELSGRNNSKIIYWLDELNKAPTLKREILALPRVQDNLANYHINQALSILQAPEEGVSVSRRTLRKLKRFLAKNEETESTENTTVSSKTYSPPIKTSVRKKPLRDSAKTAQVTKQLKECRQHYEAKRLTTGKPGTALDCYQEVLKKSPGNRQALEGLRAIENSYLLWANNALRQNRFERVRGYIQRIKKVNPRSTALAKLRRQLKTAIATQKRQQRQQQRQQKPAKSSTTPKPQTRASQSNSASNNCPGCNCSQLLKQLSMGVKPLTNEQKQFFQTQCR